MSRTFTSLKYFNYRAWFFGAFFSNIGTWMQSVGINWLVLTELTDDSGFAVGVATGLIFLPALLLSPLAGMVADLVDRRRMLMFTQAGMGLCAAALGLMVLSGVVELWQVYIFAVVFGTVRAFDGPPRMVLPGQLVPQEAVSNAVGLNSANFNMGRLIGPATAGLLIAAVGTGWVFMITACTFAATITALLVMRSNELIDLDRAKRGKGQIRAGLRYLGNRTDLVVIMIVAGVVSCLGLNQPVTQGVMAREVFDKGAQEFGILGSIMAIGSLAGALLAARRSAPRVRLVVMAAFGFGIASGVNALMPTYELYAITLIPVGLSILTMLTAANSAIQTSTDPQMRGRVMSLYTMVLLGTTPIGAPFVGWIAEVLGPRWSILVGSIAAVLVAAWAAWWASRRWNVSVQWDRERRRAIYEGPRERARQQALAADAAAGGGAPEQAHLAGNQSSELAAHDLTDLVPRPDDEIKPDDAAAADQTPPRPGSHRTHDP